MKKNNTRDEKEISKLK